ncbi:MAG: BTAD domain-containing putative transcriptional regulator [Nitrolancea sp.]
MPVQLTSFVGRERAIDEIARLFDVARLVTLTGPGGCGKTRLALQSAPLLRRRLRRDAIWVDLASITDVELIPQTIARAMNVTGATDGATLDAVIAYLRRLDPLLMLDNAEHVISTIAQTAELFLTQCPELRVLVTSREALNIPGETAWHVPPLSVPDADRIDGADALSSEAVRLFAERARSVDTSFELNADNARSVVEICRRLDGMPLAIELAASRINVLGAAEIAARLEQSFHLLTTGRRTALPRHRTLQATIDWSYEQLSEPERCLFARLSVFTGGFKLDAVEEVCSGDGIEAEDVLDLCAQLADKSLVIVDRGGSSSRFRMLQTIQQYAREKLADSGELDQMCQRHAHWCATLAQSGAELESAGQAGLVDLFEAEHDNFRAAMRWAIDNHCPETLGEIAVALWRFWLMRGYLREGESWLREASSQLPESSQLRAPALMGCAVLICHQGEYHRSEPLFREALALHQRHGDRNGEGEVLYGMAIMAQFQGHYHDAVRHFEKTLDLFEHARGRALSLMGLSTTLLSLEELDRAAELCEQSLELCREIDDDRSTASALTSLGMVALTRGDLDRAAEVCEQSLELRQTLGDRGGVAHTLTIQGYIALERKDLVSAKRELRRAFLLRKEMRDNAAMAGPIEGLAAVQMVQGDLETGVRILALAESLRTKYETPRSPIEQRICDRSLEIARRGLVEDRFNRWWAHGQVDDVASIEWLSQDPTLDDAVSAMVESSAPVNQPDPPARSTSAELSIEALGHTRVMRRGHVIEASEWTYLKARELLFFLIQSGASTREQIGLALWPDATEAQLRSAFHTTVHHLRRALGDPAWILFRNGTYAFNRARSFSYDVGEFEQELSRARGLATTDRGAAIARLERAVHLYQGTYLADLTNAEWRLHQQEELERQYVNALLLLGDLLMANNRFDAAADAYRNAIDADEFLESAHRGLMRALAAQGERGQALRHFQTLTLLLRNELSTEPDHATHHLYEQIRTDSTHR